MPSEKITQHALSPVFGRQTLALGPSAPLGFLLHDGQIVILHREFVADSPEDEIANIPRDVLISAVGDGYPDASGLRLESTLSVPGSLFGQNGQIVIHCAECNPD